MLYVATGFLYSSGVRHFQDELYKVKGNQHGRNKGTQEMISTNLN